MPGELAFAVRDQGLLFATFIRHECWATRAVWAAVVRSHLQVVRGLLDDGARRLPAHQGSGAAAAGAGDNGGSGAGPVGTLGPGA